jgi:hypothetical protein
MVDVPEEQRENTQENKKKRGNHNKIHQWQWTPGAGLPVGQSPYNLRDYWPPQR